ncbi:unnamed protein product [Symbiodinium natans]|uniref:Uncharacterized protein n=1 Tax=Symbiodinium natans TaxID=878477 RepID=A0A812ML14_9DINO|nr:unnamed protein product [Symbiodinium natans]
MAMAEPENTELSRTIEKELLNQVSESWAEHRHKALKDLYAGQPPPTGRTNSVERPQTPKWLFRGHNYHGTKTKEERDKRVLDSLAAERLAAIPSSRGDEPTESVHTQKTPPPPGFGGGTMQDWAKHMKALPGGRNWLDR